MILSIEDLMYQLGGQLPSIAQDSVTSAQLALMRPNTPDFNYKINELREDNSSAIRAADARARQQQATLDAQNKKNQISNGLSALKAMQDDLDKKSKTISGLPSYFEKAQKLDAELRKDIGDLSMEIESAKLDLARGLDVPQERFDKILSLKNNVQAKTASPEFLKLSSLSPILKKNWEVISHYSKNQDKWLIDENKFQAYTDTVNGILSSGDDFDINDVNLPEDMVVNKADLTKKVEDFVKAIVKDSKATIESLSPTEHYRILKKSKVETQDLTDAEAKAKYILGYVESLPAGEAYIRYMDGREGFLDFVKNVGLATDDTWGDLDTKAVSQSYMTKPETEEAAVAKARAKSAASREDKLTPILEQLRAYGVVPTIGKDRLTAVTTDNQIKDDLLDDIKDARNRGEESLMKLIRDYGLTDLNGKPHTPASLSAAVDEALDPARIPNNSAASKVVTPPKPAVTTPTNTNNAATTEGKLPGLMAAKKRLEEERKKAEAAKSKGGN